MVAKVEHEKVQGAVVAGRSLAVDVEVMLGEKVTRQRVKSPKAKHGPSQEVGNCLGAQEVEHGHVEDCLYQKIDDLQRPRGRRVFEVWSQAVYGRVDEQPDDLRQWIPEEVRFDNGWDVHV